MTKSSPVSLSICDCIIKENSRDRLLSKKEIKSFWHGPDNASMLESSRLALKLQLVTGQRKGEIVAAEWEEVDLINGWWTIPAHKAKNNNLHRVPLSELAVELLQQIKTISCASKWLFPSPNGTKHATPEAIGRTIRRNDGDAFKDINHFTPHDLRRTAASHMTALGVSRLIVSKLLNHVESSVTAIYDRHTYDKEKRAAMDIWSIELKRIILKNTG